MQLFLQLHRSLTTCLSQLPIVGIPDIGGFFMTQRNPFNLNIGGSLMDQTTVVEKVETDTSVKLSVKVGDKTKQEIQTAFGNLILMRKDWEQNEYARSNQKLYEIFQHCYALYLEMKGVTAEKLALKRAFNTYLRELGVNFKDSTHLMVKVVRCVFGDDRRRISSYATALRIADEKKVPSSGIVEFFNKEGGFEEVRRKKNPNAVSLDEKKAQGLALMNVPSLGFVHTDNLNAVFDESAYEGAALLMSTREPDGSFQIKYVLQNGGLVSSALVHLIGLSKEIRAKHKAEQDAANDANMRDEAVKQAVNA